MLNGGLYRAPQAFEPRMTTQETAASGAVTCILRRAIYAAGACDGWQEGIGN